MGSGLFKPKWCFAGLALVLCAGSFAGEDDATREIEEIIAKSQADAGSAAGKTNELPDPFDAENDDVFGNAFTIHKRPDRFPLDNFKVQSFLTLSDFLKIGYECYGRYVVKRGDDYANLMGNLRKNSEGAVVVLDIRNRTKPSGFMTGALINGGKHVLSAGHFEFEPASVYVVHVNDGRSFSAKLAAHRTRDKGDWAIFEVTAALKGAAANLPSLELSAAAAEPELFSLGYPCTKFIHDGRIVSGKKCGFRGRPFPVLAQKTMEMEGNWVLQGLAGATPMPGSSGSPVLNVSTGKIVGIYVATAFDSDDTGGEVPSDVTILQVVPVSAMTADLDKLKIPYQAGGGRRPRN